MKRIAIILAIISLIFVLFSPKVLASFEKIGESNNKFGIHLAIPSEEDLKDAADLVNSSGGDWGYVTLVIEEKDRDKGKWQGVFDLCRHLHLIPIVRLATSVQNSGWRQPEAKEAEEWTEFLNSLNWVIKNRYIVLFNEPNHGREWGGEVNPEHYAQVAFNFAKTLKETNSDFFVMLAGFDAAAPHKSPLYEDEEIFLKRILSAEEKFFEYLDGWSSHSYPNHGYIGSPTDKGRNSIRTYIWELELLKGLGVEKELPVFITETGWPHQEGLSKKANFYSASTAAENFKIYFDQLINDEKVIAITPFILNYQGKPFDHFSWRKPGQEKEFYPQHDKVLGISKVKGEPKQEQKFKIINKLPEKFIEKSSNKVGIKIRNEGQAIWSKEDGYKLKLTGESAEKIVHSLSDFSEIMPFREKTVWLDFEIGDESEGIEISLAIVKDGEIVSNQISWSLETVSRLSIDGILIWMKGFLEKF